MKLCASTYSIGRFGINQIDAIKKAKELGFEAIEIAEISPHDGSSKQEYAKKIKVKADKEGVKIANFVFGCNLASPVHGETMADEMAYVKEMIDIAEILGVKVIRHDATFDLGDYPSFDAALPDMADRAREITEYAQKKGIKTTVENHGFICQQPDRMEKLFNAVNHENFGLLCDMGNFLCSDSDPVDAVSLVAPYASYVHVKDFYVKSGNSIDNPGKGFFQSRGGNFLKGSPIGHGVVPVTQCLGILKRAGYDGFITIEYEGDEPLESGLVISRENLERYINNI